jgi:zinc transporter ZupT
MERFAFVPRLNTEPHTEYNTATNFWLKIASIVVLGIEAFIGGMGPYWSVRCRQNPKILGIGNAFAGGVFVSIAFIHIMPE